MKCQHEQLHCKSKLSDDPPFLDATIYRNLAGALRYLTCSHLGVTYVVQQVCLSAWSMCGHYVQSIINHGLHFYPSTFFSLSHLHWCWLRRLSRNSLFSFLLYLLSRGQLGLLGIQTVGLLFPISVSGQIFAASQMLLLRHVAYVICSLNYIAFYYNVGGIYFSSNPIQHQHTKQVELDIYFVHEKVVLDHIWFLHVIQYHFCRHFHKRHVANYTLISNLVSSSIGLYLL